MDANYILNRTMEKLRAIIDRKVTLTGIRGEFEPKYHWTYDFWGKEQGVTPLEMATDLKPTLLDMYILNERI